MRIGVVCMRRTVDHLLSNCEVVCYIWCQCFHYWGELHDVSFGV